MGAGARPGHPRGGQGGHGPRAARPDPDRPQAPPPGAALPSGLESVVAALAEGQQRLQETLVALLGNRPDPMAQMQQMLQMMALMREAMGGAPKSSVTELVEGIGTNVFQGGFDALKRAFGG